MGFMIVVIVTMMSMIGALMLSYGNVGVSNCVYYLGITLPKGRRDCDDVKNIGADYRKRMRLITLAACVSASAVIFMRRYVSLILVYVILWFFAFVNIYTQNLKRSGWRLYNWKISQDWYEKKTPLVRVDTAASSRKGNMSLPMYYAIIPMAAAVYGAVRMIGDIHNSVRAQDDIYGATPAFGKGTRAMIICSLLCIVIFLGIWYAVAHSQNKVYCDDSDVNYRINRSIKYEWSRCAMVHAYGAAVLCLIFGSGMYDKGSLSGNLTYLQMCFIACVFLVFLVSGVFLFAAYGRTRQEKEAAAPEKLYDDDDIYYLTGKKNPHQKGMSEKRAGIGFSFNMDGKGEAVIVGITIAFVCAIAFFMLKYDLADIRFDIKEDGARRMAVIEAAGDKTSFYIDELVSVNLLEKYPSMSKNSGYDGTRFYFGSFHVAGYGVCTTYVCLENSKVIVAETIDKKYVFNDESADETEKIYEEIVGFLRKR